MKIWTTDPPYEIEGEFWSIQPGEWYWPEFGLGIMPKPFQKPHPKIALAGMSPHPYFIQQAGKRDWIAISANFIPPNSAATHWQKYVQGAEEAGHEPNPTIGIWRGRSSSRKPIRTPNAIWRSPAARRATISTI